MSADRVRSPVKRCSQVGVHAGNNSPEPPLSIRRPTEAFDYICERLENIKNGGGSFIPILIERIVESRRTQCVKTRHIVPETGMTMTVYHLVLQLSGKDRHGAAIKART